MLKNTILLATVLIVLAFVGEAVVRHCLRDITSTADNASYFAKRWKADHVRLNRWGYRDRDFDQKKQPGVYRIVMVGDSVTYGQGIEEKERVSNIIEEELNGSGRRYEVLNFGRPGAEIIDHFHTIGEQVLRVEPDYILLQWYINDFEGEVKTNRPLAWPLVPYWQIHSWLHERSALYYLLNQQWMSFQIKMGIVPSYPEYLFSLFGDPESLEAKKALQTLGELVDLCHQYHVEIGIVLFPDTGYLEGRPYPYEYLHERVAGICKQKDLLCVDIRPALEPFYNSRDYQKLRANRLDGHPSALVNRIAAERILNTFAPVWREPEHMAVSRPLPQRLVRGWSRSHARSLHD